MECARNALPRSNGSRATDPDSDVAGAALILLPPESRQHAVVSETVKKLSAEIEKDPQPPKKGGKSGWEKRAAGLGALGLLAWKFKVVVLVILGKGKLLLLGLTKASTLLSMLLSIGVYWTLWGWQFALGFVVAMYIHEMGHVAALRRYGIAATAPMFVPGLGAFVRLKQYPATPREDSRVGLAGPLWGAIASVVAYLIGKATDVPVFLAIAHFSAWMNVFNLLPLWSLDGGRGFRSMAINERWLASAAAGVAWFFTQEPILAVVGMAGVLRSLGGGAPKENDREVTFLYIGLIAALALLVMARPPGV